MAHVDRERRQSGDDVAARRLDGNLPHRQNGVRTKRPGDFVQLGHDFGGGHKRILATMHRRRAGVTCLAHYCDIKAANALRGGHYADLSMLRLEYWSLFDVQFEMASPILASAGHISHVTTALQFRSEAAALFVLTGVCPIAGHDTGPHA